MENQNNQWGNFEEVKNNEFRFKPIGDSIKALKRQTCGILTPFNSEVASQIVEDLSKVRNTLNNPEYTDNLDNEKSASQIV